MNKMYLSILSGAKEALEALINTIVDFFNNCGDLISNFFSGVNKAIPTIHNIVVYLIDIIDEMPLFLKSFALISITISVVYFFIGREQG